MTTMERTDTPRFCPRCAREALSCDTLCRYCGTSTEAQGHCGVCEAFWPGPVDSPCPKHDVPLEAAPRTDEVLALAGEHVDWQTVARYSGAAEAQAPRLRLEAEGIPTFLDGLRMASDILNHPAVGGVKLQVPAALVDEARVLLDQSWEVPPPVDDLDEAWDELGPEPGAWRRAIMRRAILLILALPLLVFVLELVIMRVFRAG